MPFVQDLKRNKAGLIVGALVGLATTLYLKTTGVDLTFAIVSPGTLDAVIVSWTSLANLAVTKVGIAFITIGAFIGYVIDEHWI